MAYIDGFNFYYGLMAKGWGRHRWLDFRALMSRRIRHGQVLAGVRYFTALVTHQPEKLARQENYLRALEHHTGITPILGNFESRRVRCRVCGEWYKRPQEKRTDVNFAMHLVTDAFDDAFDTAYLVCADGDLAPAVALVRERFRKRIVLIDPPRRHSEELAQLADAHWHFSESHVRQSQLPDPVTYVNRRGKPRHHFRPSTWR